ncbi:MAG TPA: S8 family serine peptidase [Longimicrobiaceae bacterium]|nr:S8 family serine peptidase [Longimicrobiaceae bacterium]
MEIKREWLERLIFEGEVSRRFTQDSPVLPDVWIRYGMKLTRGEEPVLDLLLTPHADSTAGALFLAVQQRVDYERREGGHWQRLRDPGGEFQALLAAAREAVYTPPEDEEARDDTPCDPELPNLAYNQSTVVGCLHLAEVVRVLLPLTYWWRRSVCHDPGRATLADLDDAEGRAAIERDLDRIASGKPEKGGPADLLWLVKVVGSMLAAAGTPDTPDMRWEDRWATWKEILADNGELTRLFRQHILGDRPEEVVCPGLPEDTPLFMVSRNRKAKAGVAFSVQAVKADAARRVFNASCAKLAWAILDSGIDATHPAFRRRRDDVVLPSPFEDDRGRPGNGTRVDGTFDFTRIRFLLSGSKAALRREADEVAGALKEAEAELAAAGQRQKAAEAAAKAAAAKKGAKAAADAAAPPAATEAEHCKRRVDTLAAQLANWSAFAERDSAAQRASALKTSLLRGRAIDWDELRPLLEVEHVEGIYRAPRHEHGTHVAGILAADWRSGDWDEERDEHTASDMQGVCPDIHLYDFRVFDDEGSGDEFSVMAALQFLRHLNAQRELPLIHGANLSLAIRHDVANYACGRTPVCDECERVVNAGVVVVAAAGNYGYHRFATLSDTGAASTYEGYSDISITDPGNADAVITVGSTHRIEPHTYGVSYFSSRGPTGDGRSKPDLVAPGEKIRAPVPGCGATIKDGTSMAAPHVSGAAALVLARYGEFIGRPARVKQILCSNATDLGRDRYFQGAGMVDVLRALQSV